MKGEKHQPMLEARFIAVGFVSLPPAITTPIYPTWFQTLSNPDGRTSPIPGPYGWSKARCTIHYPMRATKQPGRPYKPSALSVWSYAHERTGTPMVKTICNLGGCTNPVLGPYGVSGQGHERPGAPYIILTRQYATWAAVQTRCLVRMELVVKVMKGQAHHTSSLTRQYATWAAVQTRCLVRMELVVKVMRPDSPYIILARQYATWAAVQTGAGPYGVSGQGHGQFTMHHPCQTISAWAAVQTRGQGDERPDSPYIILARQYATWAAVQTRCLVHMELVVKIMKGQIHHTSSLPDNMQPGRLGQGHERPDATYIIPCQTICNLGGCTNPVPGPYGVSGQDHERPDSPYIILARQYATWAAVQTRCLVRMELVVKVMKGQMQHTSSLARQYATWAAVQTRCLVRMVLVVKVMKGQMHHISRPDDTI
ncbi:hypothetical protein J6590_034171 [Homalodisca vitripennis]|nr:hypothetical protein J6590_034171 [Homalodisca vitripennis]